MQFRLSILLGAAFCSRAFALEAPATQDAAKEETWSERSDRVLEKVKDQARETWKDVKVFQNHSRNMRAASSLSLGLRYAYLDFLVPGKIGASAAYQEDADRAWELTYLQGSFAPFMLDELGEFKEKRVLIQMRNYLGSNTFSLAYGLMWNRMSLELGSRYFDSVPVASSWNRKIFEIDTLGASFSLGNRWVFGEHFTLGADWFGLHQPLFKIKEERAGLRYVSEDDKEEVEKTLHWMTFFPRITVLNVFVGFIF